MESADPTREATKSFSPLFPLSSEWITALPVIGPFLLLALVLMRQYPSAPNPAMAAGLCFFAVAIFLARYFKSQEILTVTLAAMTVTLLSWGLKDFSRTNLICCFWMEFIFMDCCLDYSLMLYSGRRKTGKSAGMPGRCLNWFCPA